MNIMNERYEGQVPLLARGGRGHGPKDLILFLGDLVTDFPAKEMSKHAVPLGPGDRHGTEPR